MNRVLGAFLHDRLFLVPMESRFGLGFDVAFHHDGSLLFDPDDSRWLLNDRRDYLKVKIIINYSLNGEF